MAIRHLEQLKDSNYFSRNGLPCVVREMHTAPSNAIIPMHDHEFSELVVVTSGNLNHIHATGTDKLYMGDFFVIHPGERHGYTNLTPKTTVFNILYHCSCPPVVLSLANLPLLPYIFPRHPSGCRAHTIGRIPKRELPHIVNLIREIRREEEARRPLGSAICSSLFAALLLRLSCVTADVQFAVNGPIQAEIDFIVNNLADKITFKELCAVSGKSVSTLSRQFKRLTGRSPGNYIVAMRVEKAKLLLAQPQNIPLSKIAAQTGFCDASHLSRTLRNPSIATFSSAPSKPS